MSIRAQIWLLLFALIGLAAAGTSAYVHYQLLHQPGYTTTFCDIDETVSCSQVYLSRFGSVRGVPVALGGVIWFASVLVLVGAARAGTASFRQSVAGYLFALATFAIAAILYLAYASFFVLHSVCILCLVTYAVVMGIFLVSGAVSSVPMKTLPRRLVVDLRALVRSPRALVVALLFFGCAGSAVAVFRQETTLSASLQAAGANLGRLALTPPANQGPTTASGAPSEFERWYTGQPRVNLPVAAEGAKVLVIKFTDYQCPACAQTYLWYKPILAKYAADYPGQVRLVSLDFPLNPSCNGAVTRPLHFAVCEAAVAVRLAREHGQGEAMEEWLAANQPSLTPEGVKAAARQVGGVTDFDARYAGVLQAVKTDAALGALNNVRSTPTFFINGTMIVSPLAPQFFDQAIALELKRAGL
jgi:uncharacterized membrane protein/protein-disulfide isomerase